MWTASALASEARRGTGTVWRAVEHQYTASTRKLVDTAADQDTLESVLESSKPPYPPEAEHLHYLLKTPFRYYPPRRHGGRFSRPSPARGVFYAAERIRTALAEMAYYRLRFFQASPGTPTPKTQERLTVFSARYRTGRRLDLTRPPLDRDRAVWTHSTDYAGTQALADLARTAGIEVLSYQSVRDPEQGANVALLSPAVFTQPAPLALQTWFLYLGDQEIDCERINAAGEGEKVIFKRAALFPQSQE
ncbi:MAG: RES family NAD+ phosphorylase [Gammaproteobacteria bacterium]